MSDLLTAPVLLGVSGASLMIAAAIVAVAISWATATPALRGVLVLAVAGAVGALAAWLRRLHLVITSGSVGLVAMGFAGMSAVAYMSELAALSSYAAPVAFLVAGAAGVVLARLRIAWVGPSTAVALTGFAVALTSVMTAQAADAWASWAWSLTAVVTALGLARSHALWPWRVAQHIVRWAAVSWACVAGAIAAAWTWFGDVSLIGAVAAGLPILALVVLARRWPQVPTVGAVILTTAVVPGVAHVAGASGWQQIAVVAATLAVVVGVGARLSTVRRRWVLAGLVPGYATVTTVTVLYALLVVLRKLGDPNSAVPGTTELAREVDVWAGVAALLAGAAVMGLRTWKLSRLKISSDSLRIAAVTGPLAMIAGITVVTLTAMNVAAPEWSLWAWSVTGTGLLVMLAATYGLWVWPQSRTTVGWAGLIGISVVGAVAALWVWFGDVSVISALAAVVPIAALAVLGRLSPRLPLAIAVLLATVVAPGTAFAAGATAWQQIAVLAGTLAAGIAAGLPLSAVNRRALALGLVPGYVIVGVVTAGYAVITLIGHSVNAMEGSLPFFIYNVDRSPSSPVDLWAGIAALVGGVSVAGLRTWRLRNLSPDAVRVLHAGSVGGALMVVAGVVLVATSVAQPAAITVVHSVLASTLAVAGLVLILARVLWADSSVQRVSSLSGVVLATLAGIHGVWALALGELPVIAALGIALAPAAVLAAWGVKRPVEGTVLAGMLATAIAGGLAAALGASPELAFTVVVGLAAVVVWTVRYLPTRQHHAALIGMVPALGWGLLAGAWSVSGLAWWIGKWWMNSSALGSTTWAVQGWLAAAGLVAAVAFAAVRNGPWRQAAGGAERTGAALALVTLPSVLASLGSLTILNTPATTIGVVVASALIAAGGLAFWRDQTARRLTRVGATAGVLFAGLAGWMHLAHSTWDFATTLGLSLAALALLAVASRWWPRVALAPATLMATAAPAALAERAEWGFTATAVLMMVGVALVLLALMWLPHRYRVLALIGLVPALAVAAVTGVVVTTVAAVHALAGSRAAFQLEAPWWATSLAVTLVVVMHLLQRLNVSRRWLAVAQVGEAFALVGAALVATLPFATLAAPGVSQAPERLLLTPVTALVAGAIALVWATRSMAPRQVNVVLWGVVGWVTALAIALEVWIYQGRVEWLIGGAMTVGVAVALVALGRRWPLAGLIPATVLLTMLPFAVMPPAFETPLAASACVAAVLGAAAAWLARELAPLARRAVLLGLILPAIALVKPLLGASLWTLAIMNAHLQGRADDVFESQATVSPWWHVGLFAATALALLAWPKAARMRGWLLLMTAVVASAALSPVWAVTLLGAAALVLLIWGNWLRVHATAAVIAVLLAMVWAIGSDVALAVTGAVATVIAGAIALGWRTTAQTWGAVVAPLTAVVTGVFASRAVGAETMAIPFGLGLAMVTVIALVSTDRRRLRQPVAITAAAITVAVPLFASSLSIAGVALLLAATAWWRLHTAGLTWAKWMCAIAASAGAAALLAGADIYVIEAYTAVPAATAILIGLQWMRDRPQLRSLPALAPGLAAALIPSFVALVLEPDALWRTIALVGAVIVLALIGLRLRWFAPILATAFTAVVLSVLQIIVGANLVVRLVAFAVVGALLLAISSYFERLKELR